MRIAWVSPMTPASGVGSFSQAVTRCFPASIDGEAIDLTILHPPHPRLHRSRHRMIPIGDVAAIAPLLGLFDVVVYNIGNNDEHHGAIFELLAIRPGIVISHDYVYQHYLAGRLLRGGRGFASYAALLARYGSEESADDVRRSRITSRRGDIRYSPWDSEHSVRQPVGNLLFDLASALVTHSAFAERYARQRFRGPVLRLGMPWGQKRAGDEAAATRDGAGGTDAERMEANRLDAWRRELSAKRLFDVVSFGHIQPSKALDVVIEAIAIEPALRKRLRYTVAGIVSCKETFAQLREQVAVHGLGDVVRFETAVPESRLAQLMETADVFINLRRPNTEGSSASLVEQLETGRPVVILDSGCYAELPGDAACKLPADATAADLGRALAALLDDPAGMAAVGAAGRAYARSWSCAGYAEALARFVQRQRDLLRDRAQAIGACPLAQADEHRAALATVARDGDWGSNLADARRSFAYLERGLMTLDPAIVMGLSREALCRYVAETVFGLFNNAALLRALARYFAGRSGRAVYWACARFALVADAVMSNDAAARARLQASEQVLDPEFWRVIEHLGADAFRAAALILLGERMPAATDCDEDDDGFPTRLRVAELLKDSRCWREEAARPLRSWLEQPGLLPPDADLPILDGDVDWAAGASLFRAGIDLSGFYAMEADHVWSRGTRAFVGLRPGPDVTRVELQLRSIDADPDRPCRIGVSLDGEGSSLQLVGPAPVWLGVDLPRRAGGPIGTSWFGLWSERASPPPNSADPRPLGLCLLRLRLATARTARIPHGMQEWSEQDRSGEEYSGEGRSGLDRRDVATERELSTVA